MKRIRKSGKPDLSEWSLETVTDLQAAISPFVLKAASEALTLAMEHEDTYAYMPAIWGPDSDGAYSKAPPDDPLTIYFSPALGDSDKDPIYSTSLREILKDDIETTREDGSFAEGLEAIALAMREFADEIAAAAAEGKRRFYDEARGAWATKSDESERWDGPK